jgi:hypothetical protein
MTHRTAADRRAGATDHGPVAAIASSHQSSIRSASAALQPEEPPSDGAIRSIPFGRRAADLAAFGICSVPNEIPCSSAVFSRSLCASAIAIAIWPTVMCRRGAQARLNERV